MQIKHLTICFVLNSTNVMKKLCFFVIYLFLLHGLFQPAIAQTGQATISAVVKDSAAQKAMPFVTVELFKGAQFTQPVKTSYSNDKGKFKPGCS